MVEIKSIKKIKILILIFGIIFGLSVIIINHNSGIVQVDNESISKENKKINIKSSSGDWDPQITKPIGLNPESVFIEDVNNDGYNDIAATNFRDDNVSIFIWNITIGDWDPQITRSVGDGPYKFFIGDANNDGYNDIITANYLDSNVSILLWNTTTSDWDPQITRSVGDMPFSIFLGDANNDGYNDIVTANGIDDTVSILLWNASSGDWDDQTTRSVGTSPCGLSIGDANNDGYNDIVNGNPGDDNVSILLWNKNSDDWDPQITRSVGNNAFDIFLGDANHDGYNDIVAANWDDTNVSILLWNAALSDWDPQITRSVGNNPFSIFLEDANNDGYNDIVTANDIDDTVSILLWNASSGDWDDQIIRSVGNQPFSVFIGDANNDGYNDIATVNNNDATISILLWNSPPSIKINTPKHNDLFGKATPNFNVEVADPSLDRMWYTLNGGPIKKLFLTNGTIDHSLWESQLNGTVSIRFHANDTTGHTNFAEVVVRKDIIDPIITIYEPKLEEEFIEYPPIFNISIMEPNLDTVWYTIDEGQTNITITELMGTIDQTVWDAAPNGPTTIRFYAQDKVGNIGSNHIIVTKNSPTTGTPGILGFDIFIIIGISLLVSIIMTQYFKNKHKKNS